MNTSLYIFFSTIAILMLILGLYDWGATKQKIAAFPTLLSTILSIILFAASWDIRYSSGGIELAALHSWEAYAIAVFWFLLFVISILLTLVILFEKSRDILDNMEGIN
ncbi:MAG TPA: hypothetical protein HA306_01175 [Methanosarcina sp.]|nr:hypothetical protein [Methanosarcina sp.]